MTGSPVRSAITARISGVYRLSSDGSGGGARCKVEGAEWLIEAFGGLDSAAQPSEGVRL
jgi:hypothetical protein